MKDSSRGAVRSAELRRGLDAAHRPARRGQVEHAVQSEAGNAARALHPDQGR
jgi:hypothetical protein